MWVLFCDCTDSDRDSIRIRNWCLLRMHLFCAFDYLFRDMSTQGSSAGVGAGVDLKVFF